MKKIGVLLFVLLFSLTLVSGQEIFGLEDTVENFAGKAENLEENISKFQDDPGSETINYLKQEWGKILVDWPIIGEINTGYKIIQPYSDPVFVFVLGMSPSWTWLFILTLVIFIFLIKYLVEIFSLLEYVSNLSEGTSLVITLCSISIIIVLGILKGVSSFLAEWIITLVGIITNPWFSIIVIPLVILGISFSYKYSRGFRLWMIKSIRARREQKKKLQTDMDRTVIHSTAEGLRGAFSGRSSSNSEFGFWTWSILLLLILGVILFLVGSFI